MRCLSPIALMLCAAAASVVAVAAILLGGKGMLRKEMIRLKPCPECRRTVLITDEECPHCGAPLPH
jgi:hypothetical protein